MPAYLTRFYILVAALLLAACSTTEVRQVPVIKAKAVLLLPLTSLHNELAQAGHNVTLELTKALEKRRFAVINPSEEQTKLAVDQALAAAGAVYDPSIGQFLPMDRLVYIKSLIDYYGTQFEFEVLIQPELLIRNASVVGDSASWDGAERSIELSNKPNTPYRPLKTVRGVSLKLSVYSQKGADLLHSYAGISLPYTINYRVKPPEFDLKEQLFTVKEQRQAVDGALKPFFYQVKYHAK